MKSEPSRDANTLLKQLDLAGLYSVAPETSRAAFNTAASLGFNAYRVDLSLATNAKKLLQILGRSLRFPDWFGSNWDALADCLSDLSWSEADGYLLILQRLEPLHDGEPESVTKLFELLRETANTWRNERIPFWILVEGCTDELPHFHVET